MKTNSIKTLSAAALAICFFGHPAQSAEDKSDRMNAAWSGLLAGAEPVLSPQQTGKINNLAFQAAVTRVCENFDLNQEKFAAALSEATEPANDKLGEDAMLARQNFILVDLGMRVGVLIAEGSANKSSFCANARELKAQSELPHVWE